MFMTSTNNSNILPWGEFTCVPAVIFDSSGKKPQCEQLLNWMLIGYQISDLWGFTRDLFYKKFWRYDVFSAGQLQDDNWSFDKLDLRPVPGRK